MGKPAPTLDEQDHPKQRVKRSEMRIRKHLFREPTNPMPEAPLWLGRRCVFCGKISGLDDWQIRDMPKEMARCDTGVKSTWGEFLSRSYNCLAQPERKSSDG